ncbi:restriction endonuclease subunit S, partial [Patescibacteria group bacterium]|nr:restriction endonuclease subunit S [Patescibacteria group bacterium]
MNSTFGKISTGTLITNDMNVKNQKQTEIGLVPESWKRILISDLGEIITGTTPKTIERKYYKNGKYHFIAPGDIGLTTQIYNTEKVITEEGLKVSRVLPKYSTCFVCIGSTIGKVGISTQEQSTTNQQINAVVPSDRYDPFYVCYLLKYWSEYLSSFSSPSPVPIMSKGKFQQITIYASQDNAEQIKIAKILKTIDQAIELQDKLIATTTELKQAAMEQLFTKGLHGEKQKETEIGLVPESWK